MAKSTPSIIASLLLLCFAGTALGQTTTIRGTAKGTSTPQPVTATPIDANHTGVDVNIVGGAGSGGDGAILDGVSAAIKATVFDFTNSNPLGVVLRDTNGDYVSVGGGTQYNQGTATTDTDTLTMAGCVRSDTAAVATGVIDQDRARCIVDSTGRLWVHIGTIDGGTLTSITNPVAVTGTFFQATQPISGTVTVTDGAGAVNVIVDSGTTTVTQGTATNLNAAVVGTGTAGTPAGNILTVQGVASMTKLLVTPDSVALPANQSVNVAQIAGTNTVTGGVAGLVAVGGNVANAVAATANPVPVGGIFTTTPATLTTGQTATLQFTAAQNAKTDLTTVAGTATTTAAAGTQKVGIVGNTGAALDAAGTNVAVPANEILIGCQFVTAPTTLTTANMGPVQCNSKGMHFAQLSDGTTSVGVIAGTTALKTDLSSIAGTATPTGNGTAATSLRVSLASDSTGNVATIGTSVTPGTAAGNLGKAEDVAHATGDTGVFVLGVRTDPTTTAYTTATTEYSALGVDYVGANFIGAHPGRFSCFVQNVTVTTQCQAAPAAGLRAYVTSVWLTGQTTSAMSLDLVFGTGANCATGITALTHKAQFGTNNLTTTPQDMSHAFGDSAPLVPTAANAICVRPSSALAFGATLTGFIAP